jgi:predicted enzyme related to lactoylglutathione lyase
MLLGLRTVIYSAPDLAEATAWYTKATGNAPYFNEPFYVGFNVGGYELGLLPKQAATSLEGPTTYWGVADIEVEHTRLLALGAKSHEAIKDVGDDIKVATVVDPFGNVFGLIENPHFEVKHAG